MQKFVNEYDCMQNHTIVKNETIEGNAMCNSYIVQYETANDGMEVVLEVPEQSAEDEAAKREVRKVLTTVLYEYLQKLS